MDDNDLFATTAEHPRQREDLGAATIVVPDDAVRNETLRRQIVNLLTLRPIVELAANQGRNDALPESLDVIFLALAALDFISESMGLGVGASPQDTMAHLAAICRAMDPALGEERAHTAANRVMAALENRDSTGNDHAFRFAYWTGNHSAQRIFRLVDVQEDRNDPVYVLTPDGLLACLALLDADLQSLHVDDLLVERAMVRGRIDDAMVFARRARKRSIELRARIQSVIDRAVRSPLSVRWETDGIPFLDNARAHLQDQGHREQSIIETAWDRIREASGARLVQLRDLVNTLEDTQQRHLHLFSRVCQANADFQQAQLAAFRARSIEQTVDLERDVFLPLAAVAPQFLAPHVQALINTTLPAHAPKRFDPLLMIDLLCDLPTQEATPAPEETDLTRMPVEAPWSPFTSDRALAVRDFLLEALAQRPVELSAIIDSAIAKGFDPCDVSGIFIAGLLAFDPDSYEGPTAYAAVRSGTFARGHLGGDDILFSHTQQPPLQESDTDGE